jgi:branched-chain amino acid transport system permease protein
MTATPLTSPRRIAWLSAAALAGLLAVPLVFSDYSLRVTVLALQSAIAVIGLCIAFGWAGLIQLGQAAFIGIGAYASALLALRVGLNFWIALPLAMLASGLVALVIAVPMLRLRGHYLALASVGFNVTAGIVAKNWSGVTGGYDGLGAIPGVNLFGHPIDSDLGYYYLSLGFLATAAAFAWTLRHSRFGRAMIAVRDDEIASATSGVAVVRTKVLAFVVSSMLAGLSGALYAHYAHYISPGDFELSRSVTLLVMLIAGGEMSIAGAIIGALLLGFVPEWLRFLGQAYLTIFGLAVLLLLVLMPEGVVGRFVLLSSRIAGRRGADRA